MSGNTMDIYGVTNDQTLISWIPWMWEQWKLAMIKWESDMLRTRDYLYATRTTTTDNAYLPFSNNTTVPKLAQIRSTLHSQYMKSLFGTSPWFKWVGEDQDSVTKEKADIINAYVQTKLTQSEALETLSLCVRDWIEEGNCFAKLVWVDEAVLDPKTGQRLAGYTGPKIMRVSYLTIKFNLTADSFYTAPKVSRYLMSIGELELAAQERPELGITQQMVDTLDKKKLTLYGNFAGTGLPEVQMSLGYAKDGFSSYIFYQNYQFVEVLEFNGDIFYNGKLLKNRIITVLNRQYLLRNIESPSWTGSDYLYHAAWQKRPDNIMGMGPLDNIVGMQYKLDKLENIRADMFDTYANPVLVIKGNYEQEGELGELGTKITLDADPSSRVEYLRPDPTALNADTQIAQTMSMMEMIALVPPESAGFRTPGEKTMYEVEQLAEAAQEAFNNKVVGFEVNFLEKILNDFLEMLRRNISGTDVARMRDNVYGAAQFQKVTRDDLMAVGKLKPMGSRYAQNQTAALQAINVLLNPNVLKLIAPHLSRLKIAKLISYLGNLDEYKLVTQDIGVVEDAETAVMAQAAQQKATAAQAAQQAPPTQDEPMAQLPQQQPLIQNEDTGDAL